MTTFQFLWRVTMYRPIRYCVKCAGLDIDLLSSDCARFNYEAVL